ncbi:hypothetical protein QA612_16735 [Evansella sp. AB-P1]|uniref:hypothetical protein n=1 Tax=Evansella sp. AB-P1 TaxID=3037653 RepID=UPI00241D3871|nr:hypothetical protein [Evansella sp. AB-P1]MDG5789105.1 hypothetical protein [Evansella sp. AB-P1]
MSEQSELKEEQTEQVEEVGKEQKLNYFQFLLQMFKKPEDILSKEFKGYELFGLINVVAILMLIFFSYFVQNVTLFTGTAWFAWGFSQSIKHAISFTIPLVTVIFLFNWYGNKEGNKQKIVYYFEKLGASLSLSCVLLLLSIPLNLLNITLHSWFRTGGITLMYIAIFMISYLYVAKGNFKVATVFVLGFYFVYRLFYFIL